MSDLMVPLPIHNIPHSPHSPHSIIILDVDHPRAFRVDLACAYITLHFRLWQSFPDDRRSPPSVYATIEYMLQLSGCFLCRRTSLSHSYSKTC
jgi:hypothetical protein